MLEDVKADATTTLPFHAAILFERLADGTLDKA